jgi:uncharacterized YigZ family protein
MHMSLTSDTYQTIEHESEAEIKILASRFIAFAQPLLNVDEFDRFIVALRKRHHSATHHCWAWRLGYDGAESRFSDDGEPAGTAGKRILGAIDHHHLTNTGIVVVRYFGGTKLGTGGLARAYAEAAEEAIAANTIITRYIEKRLRLEFPYDMSRSIHHILESNGAEIIEREYLEQTRYTVSVRAANYQQLLSSLREGAWKGVTVTET